MSKEVNVEASSDRVISKASIVSRTSDQISEMDIYLGLSPDTGGLLIGNNNL